MAGMTQTPRTPEVTETTRPGGWREWEVAYRGTVVKVRQIEDGAEYEAYCDTDGEPVCVSTLDRAVEMVVESRDRGWI